MSVYTDEMVARLAEVYKPDASDEIRRAQVDELAKEFGVSTRSVIGKLTTEGLYTPYTKVESAPKEKAETRKEIVADIAGMLGLSADSLASFCFANKGDLEVARTALSDKIDE